MGADAPLGARRALALALGLALCPPLAGVARGQGGSTSVVAVPTAVALPTPGIVQFQAGRVQYQGTVQLQIRVPSNRIWTLFVRSTDPDLGGYGKPIGDLLWRRSGLSPWTGVTANEVVVATGTGDATVLVEVAVAIAEANDPPGNYDGSLLFRVQRED